MALPSAFTTSAKYFESCLNFLQKYAWIYQHANTNFLKNGVLEHMTHEEKLYFCGIKTEDLNIFPQPNRTLEEKLPATLQEFRELLILLIPDTAYADPVATTNATFPTLKKMNIKKQHEICRLAHRINELCTNENEILIDFGAGHGYLSEMLIRMNSNFLILGLEAEKKRVEAARIRQTENFPTFNDAVIYKEHFIIEESQIFVEENAEKLQRLHTNDPSSSYSWSIIGLHACADLTVTSMRLFLAMPRVRRLIIMPCCYHKLKMSESGEFLNFPLSKSLRAAVADIEMGMILNRPFLRLACQQTLARWKCSNETEHLLHGIEMWQRALAESILDDEHEVVIRRKRKTNFEPNQMPLTFESLSSTYELKTKLDKSPLDWQWQHQQKFNKIIEKYPDGAKLAEGLTCLQTTMQKLCENIVLYDRLCYIQECAAIKGARIKARFEKLMNEKLSPRCYVLIAEKLD